MGKSNFFLRAILCAVAMVSMTGELFADTVYLKNGRQVTGMIKREDEFRVELDIGFGVVGFKLSEIERIYRSNASETVDIQKRWDEQKIESQLRAQEAKAREDAAPKRVAVSQEASGHIVVDALINQKAHASLMLDTGASLVVLTKGMAAKLGISSTLDEKEKKNIVQLIVADGRKVSARFVMLESVSVQGNEARSVEAAVLTEDADVSMKDGLLGMSFLKRFNFGIDLQNTKLTLQRL